MKREKLITVAPTRKHTKTVTVYVCDICLEDIGTVALERKNECALCERTIHDNFKCGREHPDDSQGDYPRHLCRICVDLWYQQYAPMQEKHWAEEEAMEKTIKKESLEWQTPQNTK